MLNPREEAASVVMRGNRMYIMGGLIDKEPSRNTEVLNSIDGSWEDGFSLPEGIMSIKFVLYFPIALLYNIKFQNMIIYRTNFSERVNRPTVRPEIFLFGLLYF